MPVLSMASNEMVHSEQCMNISEKVTECSVIAIYSPATLWRLLANLLAALKV